MASTRPESFLPLTPVVFDILVTLASAEQHGYAILNEVRERTGDMVRPGSLYRALNRLLEDALIEETFGKPAAPDHDERRTYYRLTSLGKRVAQAEAARLEAQVLSARDAQLLARRRQ